MMEQQTVDGKRYQAGFPRSIIQALYMRVQILQHVPFEGLGSIQSWLDARGADVNWTLFYDNPQLPDLVDVDLIIALGGPMSVNDEAELPWLVDEKQFIAAAIRAGKAVLGICLGAQLIASSLGASVYPNKLKEIGWFDIKSVSENPDCFCFPKWATVFHWHGETFDLPPGAIRLASSAACANQAFQIGANVIGLQFHLETTPDSADAIITHCRDELVAGEFVQTEGVMRAVEASSYPRINALMAQVLDYLMNGIQSE
jgi:GMP synthase-like glutamine amidotransferase